MDSGVEALYDVGVSYIEESSDGSNPQQTQAVCKVLLSFLQKQIPLENAIRESQRIIGSSSAIERINEIISLPEEPMPSISPQTPQQVENSSQNRQKSRQWTQSEDQRLLSGIYKFGLESWNPIANFVGNGRTRSQCSQRWTRGLNPKISKSAWNAEEEAKLIQLVHQLGDKSWTKIASEIGNRSDVQCRYRYQQLRKERNNQLSPPIYDQKSKKSNVGLGGLHPLSVSDVDPQSMMQSSIPSSAQLSATMSLNSQAFQQIIQQASQQQKNDNSLSHMQNFTNSMQNLLMPQNMQQSQIMQMMQMIPPPPPPQQQPSAHKKNVPQSQQLPQPHMYQQMLPRQGKIKKQRSSKNSKGVASSKPAPSSQMQQTNQPIVTPIPSQVPVASPVPSQLPIAPPQPIQPQYSHELTEAKANHETFSNADFDFYSSDVSVTFPIPNAVWFSEV